MKYLFCIIIAAAISGYATAETPQIIEQRFIANFIAKSQEAIERGDYQKAHEILDNLNVAFPNDQEIELYLKDVLNLYKVNDAENPL